MKATASFAALLLLDRVYGFYVHTQPQPARGASYRRATAGAIHACSLRIASMQWLTQRFRAFLQCEALLLQWQEWRQVSKLRYATKSCKTRAISEAFQ
jgi:hypothetical protein